MIMFFIFALTKDSLWQTCSTNKVQNLISANSVSWAAQNRWFVEMGLINDSSTGTVLKHFSHKNKHHLFELGCIVVQPCLAVHFTGN